jgi:hypothetical protein
MTTRRHRYRMRARLRQRGEFDGGKGRAGAFALNYPNTASPLQLVFLHGLLVALFAGAAMLSVVI